MITTVSLVTSSPHIVIIFFLRWELLRSTLIAAFQYATVLLTIVTMLYIISPGLIYLTPGSLYLLTTCFPHPVLIILDSFSSFRSLNFFLRNPFEIICVLTLFSSLSGTLVWSLFHVLTFKWVPKHFQEPPKIHHHTFNSLIVQISVLWRL